MSKIKAIKFVARIVVGAGTTTITHSIIRNNVEPTNLFQAISVGAAALTIGSMAEGAARAHTDARIDEFVETWNSLSKTEDPTPAT